MTTNQPITASSSLDLARAEMERMGRAALWAEGARGWWHAVRIVRLYGEAAGAMRQCSRHARFFKTSSPEKAAAYRGAVGVIARHTGVAVPGLTESNNDGDRDGGGDAGEGAAFAAVDAVATVDAALPALRGRRGMARAGSRGSGRHPDRFSFVSVPFIHG